MIWLVYNAQAHGVSPELLRSSPTLTVTAEDMMTIFVPTPAMTTPAMASEVSAFVGVPVLMLSVAAVACWVPPRRCAAVDPVVSLRNE